MEKATTNSLRREAEELGLRAGRRVDVIDSIDGEETSGGESGAALWCGYFSISFNATWADTRNASDTTPYCGQKWERRCVCVDFDKIYVIFSLIMIFSVMTGLGLWLENRRLEKENERMRKILYWRDWK